MALEGYVPDIWFPLTKKWDWQVVQWDDDIVLNPLGKKLLLQDKDLIAERGWIWAGGLQASGPGAGVFIEYLGPRGRLFQATHTIQTLHDYGADNLATPSAWTATRWAQGTAPEYAAILNAGFLLPFQPRFSFSIINGSALPVTIYKVIVTFILLWE